ncbi:CLUMA_CG010261, isoform A [Clunio marinus]|uniref:CLUMA_CG010261, isoform A n=1 Tax=Clunio marinus TaxID=568069 RepID=A0A1J1IAD1_9DIPT|nr:CLUMA_CG010261, isoform A [Clunio marinus]
MAIQATKVYSTQLPLKPLVPTNWRKENLFGKHFGESDFYFLLLFGKFSVFPKKKKTENQKNISQF